MTIHNYDFRKNHNLIMSLIVIFENFRGTFYDHVIFKDQYNSRQNLEIIRN